MRQLALVDDFDGSAIRMGPEGAVGRLATSMITGQKAEQDAHCARLEGHLAAGCSGIGLQAGLRASTRAACRRMLISRAGQYRLESRR